MERRLGVMGTSLELEVEAGERARALEASEAAVRAIEETERRLSTWREDSDLALLNRSRVGEPVALARETAAELREALGCAAETSGAFDPTAGVLVRAWDLRGKGRIPGEDELRQARARTGYEGLKVVGQRAIRARDVVVEEGAFGKGAALDRAAEALRRAGARAAWIDLGGQVLVLGRERVIPIAHPRKRHSPALELTLASGSVATTGNSERMRVVDGQPVGHVLDPRTGRPARELGSVSVIAPGGARADCLSTALYVLGPRAALEWARLHPGVEVAILEESEAGLRVLASPGLRGLLRPAPGASVRFEFDSGEVR